MRAAETCPGRRGMSIYSEKSHAAFQSILLLFNLLGESKELKSCRSAPLPTLRTPVFQWPNSMLYTCNFGIQAIWTVQSFPLTSLGGNAMVRKERVEE
jgi:hypothetical protein